MAHIYFNYKETEKQKPVDVVSSLIKQLATQTTQLTVLKEIEALYEAYSPKSKRPTYGELKKALLAIISYFPRVFFVFDALDECEEKGQRNTLLPLFHNLGENGASIFLTSRPFPRDISQSLSVESVAKIELSAQEEDIRIYVGEKINEDSHARNLITPAMKADVISTLIDCSRGM